MVIKYAMTLDGKIATKTGASKWITGERARKHVHELRGRYSAIMAGIGTVLADDPMLNCRTEGAHQPVRIICDSKLRIPLDSKIVKTAAEYRTIVVCAYRDEAKIKELTAKGVTVWELPCEDSCAGDAYGSVEKKVDLKALMAKLHAECIDSVLAEGGGTLHEALIREGLADHIMCYIAPKIFGGKDAKTPVEGLGIKEVNEALMLTNGKVTAIGEDILLEYDTALEHQTAG